MSELKDRILVEPLLCGRLNGRLVAGSGDITRLAKQILDVAGKRRPAIVVKAIAARRRP